jgi:hypothetical protein
MIQVIIPERHFLRGVRVFQTLLRESKGLIGELVNSHTMYVVFDHRFVLGG